MPSDCPRVRRPRARALLRAFSVSLLIGSLCSSLSASIPAFGAASAATPASKPRLDRSASPLDGAHADFNGDGYSDLAVGSYGESLPGAKTAGAVSVIYGSATGLASAGNQFLTENDLGMPGDGAQTGDVFGRTVAAGDFNGDGFADLAIGAYAEDVDTIVDAGAVTILYGSAAGIVTDGSQWWTENSPGIAGDGAEDGDRLGHYFGVGDFNGDTYQDLAMGSDLEDVDTVVDAGATTVLYGSATGLSTTGSQWWTANSQGMPGNGAGTGDSMGRSYTAGDFNADGFEDLVVTVYLQTADGKPRAGSVYVLYGSAAGLQDDGTGGPVAQYWTQNSPGMPGDGSEGDDNWGRQPAAGDYNADGYDDVAIGAWQEGVGGDKRAGSITVLYGSVDGLTTNGAAYFTQDTPGIAGDGAEPWDQWGRTTMAADFNQDGFDDLAAGAYGDDVGGVEGAGSVIVLYGSSIGLDVIGSQVWNQDSNSVRDTAETYDEFGKGLGIGDFNADGAADLAIGAYWEDARFTQDIGIVNVLYGTSVTGLQANAPDDQVWGQGKQGLLDQAEKGDRFGWIFG
jgi:hypothetical protein